MFGRSPVVWLSQSSALTYEERQEGFQETLPANTQTTRVSVPSRAVVQGTGRGAYLETRVPLRQTNGRVTLMAVFFPSRDHRIESADG